jgi:DNA-binding transcriptional ArsR family regulator
MPAIHTIKLNTDEGTELRLDYSHLRKTVLVIRSVNHKLRQQMIKLLEEYPQLTVTEIYIKMRLEQSIASQHLAILRRSGVVITKRSGKFIYYSLNQERLSDIGRLIRELAK